MPFTIPRFHRNTPLRASRARRLRRPHVSVNQLEHSRAPGSIGRSCLSLRRCEICRDSRRGDGWPSRTMSPSRLSVAWRRPKLETGVHPYEVRERIRLHLAHHPTSMRLHGDLADAKFTADLLVQETG